MSHADTLLQGTRGAFWTQEHDTAVIHACIMRYIEYYSSLSRKDRMHRATYNCMR